MFWATLTAGVLLTLWGLIVNNTGGFVSGLWVKVLPFFVGLWCLFECARVYL